MTTAARSLLRVMIVDADSTYRRGFAAALAEHPAIQIVATAMNARTALPKAESYRPDVILVDLANAEVDGLLLIEQLQQRQCGSQIVALVAAGETAGLDRVRQLGVIALVSRPPAGAVEAAVAALARELAPRLLQQGGMPPAPVAAAVVDAARVRREPPPRPAPPAAAPVAAVEPARRTAGRRPLDIVGIGISTGGPKALAAMLPQLPADFPLPIVIVQHMPASFTGPLADSLARSCKLPVREAKTGDGVVPGVILIAPGGRQMKVARAAEGCVVRITDDPPEQSCRPSVDYLFRSLHQVYGAGTLAVVMTGMGEDGLQGCKLLHAAGALVFAQDEASSTVYGMPRAVVLGGVADVVAPLDELAQRLVDAAGAAPRGR